MDMEKNKRLEEAVGLTWRIALAHGCPSLTLRQLIERLVSGETWNEQNIEQISKKLGQVLIKERDYVNIYEKQINKRIKSMRKVLNFWEKLTWVKMVAVTGSVAGGYPEKVEDTDLMLVCANNRLWLCRLISYFWLKKNKVELRSEKIEIANSLCLNLWLEEKSLVIEESKQNLAVAQDALMCLPVIDKEDIKLKMLAKNSWIKKYLATGYEKYIGKWLDKKVKSGSELDIIGVLNWVCYGIQRIYMCKKIGKEVVKYDRAYFHPYG